MKYLNLIFCMCFLLLASFQMQAQHNHGSHDHGAKTEKTKVEQKGGITDIIMVYGNCAMCKKRIEGSLEYVKGIHSVNWEADTKVLTVKYDNEIISKDEIKKKVADAGHDTDKFRANQEIYDKLPGCCQYDRPE